MIIYAIKYSNKIIYIGQTIRSLKKRISSYKSNIKYLKNKQYIINHLRKYGIENHEFVKIDSAFSKKELNNKEIYYIILYNTIYPNGLNLTTGGDSPEFSQETRNKMSKSRLGKEPWNKGKPHPCDRSNRRGHSIESKKKRSENSKGNKNPFFGKKHSQKTLNIISKKLKGRKIWNSTKGKILQFDSQLNLIKIFQNYKEVNDSGLDWHSVRRAIRTNKTYKKFYFRIEE